MTATLSASGESLTSLFATRQPPLRDLQIHRFALLMILGVSQRAFHHFYDLPAPSYRLSLVILPVLNAAIIGEATGLVLMRQLDPIWASVGFVSLMVMGVAAKVVPTLNGLDHRRLSSLWAPFLFLNAGCLLRVVGQTTTDFSAIAFPAAGVSGFLEVTGLTLWGLHLARIMLGKPRFHPTIEAQTEAKVINLQAAVEPPADGIISRTIFQVDRLKTVLFGFGVGQELSEHTASKPAVIHFLSGEAHITLGGEPLAATAGTWIHLAAGLSHSIMAKTPTVMLLALLK